MKITCSRDKGSFSFYQFIALNAPEGEPVTSKAESHCRLIVWLSVQAQKSKPGTSGLFMAFPHHKKPHHTAKLAPEF